MPSAFSKTREPRDHQRGMTWQDQHGRKWGGLFEMESEKDPKGRSFITWVQLWATAFISPIDIPPHCIVPAVDETGEQLFGQVRIDYPRWKAENAEARRGWRDRVRLIAKKMFPNTYGEAIKNPPTDLLLEAGPMPLPLEFIEAAEVGNKWALGLLKPDGSLFTRPSWVTPEMLDARDALKRATGWREDVEAVGPADASRYPDAEEPEAVLVGAGVPDEDDDDDYVPEPVARPRRRR